MEFLSYLNATQICHQQIQHSPLNIINKYKQEVQLYSPFNKYKNKHGFAFQQKVIDSIQLLLKWPQTSNDNQMFFTKYSNIGDLEYDDTV